MLLDPYYCLSCHHKGVNKGLITILSECEKCQSLLIVPIASMHVLDIDALSMSLPSLLAEDRQYRQRKGKRHLKLVQPEVTKNGTEAEDDKT